MTHVMPVGCVCECGKRIRTKNSRDIGVRNIVSRMESQ